MFNISVLSYDLFSSINTYLSCGLHKGLKVGEWPYAQPPTNWYLTV